MKIAVVIPAHNEETTIVETINKVKPLVSQVIIVDDGSTDHTYQLAKGQGASGPSGQRPGRVRVLRHIVNRGQGAALQTGSEYALANQADIIVHFDADGQFLAPEIKEVVKPIKSGDFEVVFGSRFLEKKSNIPWFKEHIIIPIAHLVNKLIIGFSLTDPQSGFRAMSRKAGQKIKIENDGMAHCSEILYKVFKNNFKVKEVPITVVYHGFGQRFGGGIKIVKDLLLAKLMS